MRRYLVPLIILGVMPFTFVPSHAVCPAGQPNLKRFYPPCLTYSFDYGETRGASVTVKLSGGGKAVASLQEFTQVSFAAQHTEKPNPAPRQGFFIGCITVTVKGKTDGGCSLLPGSQVSVDPTLSSVIATFSVKSKLVKNQEVVASLILSAAGAPNLRTTPQPTPEATNTVTMTHGPQIQRPANVIGSIRSWVIGGGAVSSTVKAAAYYGIGGTVWATRGANPFPDLEDDLP